MNIIENGDKLHQQGIDQLLTEGIFVNTRWNWEGIITAIDTKHFRHGQGVSIIRIGDNARFNIHPTDIINVS